ncbi:MAG TPA: hypothetical protein VNJ08_15400 [Bacteriovoracaceae bacterium]|nr:hypothetical protein [Bacteriovoracaceae bacterium]
MKNLIVIFLMCFLVFGFKSPEIMVDTKLDYDWSALLVTKFRQAMKNYNIDDPFSGKFRGPMLISEFTLGAILPAHTLPLVNDMGNVIGLKLVKTETKVELFDLAYDIKGFKTDLRATEQMSDGLVLDTDFSASELFLSSEKLRFSLVIPGKKESILLEIDVIKPTIRAREDRLINISTKIKIQELDKDFKLKILKANFEKMAQGLLDHPEDVELNYESIVIPEISIRVGNRSLDFSPAKIQKLIRSKHKAIKSILLAQMASVLRKGTAEAALAVLEKYRLAKDHWTSLDLIKAQIKISEFSSAFNRNNLEVKMPADFCTTKNFNKMKKECVNHKLTKTAETRIDNKLHLKSLATMKNLMETGSANMIASISEDYLNKLLVTTYDAGLWKEILKEAGVELGPNKVHVRMDKKGDSGTFIMDVIYTASKFEKFVIGRKLVRFPLVLDVSIRVEKSDNEPVLIVRLNDVDLTDKTLLNGKPELNIHSGIKDIPRFKKKILKTIRSKLVSLKNKDVIELRFPELTGLGLDKVDLLSDGNGRMNALMRLEDLIEPPPFLD